MVFCLWNIVESLMQQMMVSALLSLCHFGYLWKKSVSSTNTLGWRCPSNWETSYLKGCPEIWLSLCMWFGKQNTRCGRYYCYARKAADWLACYPFHLIHRLYDLLCQHMCLTHLPVLRHTLAQNKNLYSDCKAYFLQIHDRNGVTRFLDCNAFLL